MDKKTRKMMSDNFTQNFIQQFLTMLLGSFTLVASLAWNDVIRDFFDRITHKALRGQLKLFFAISVTVLSVLLLQFIQHMYKKDQSEQIPRPPIQPNGQ